MDVILDRVVRAMKVGYGEDISAYDELFLLKTINGRMAAAGAGNPETYVEWLLEHPAEAVELRFSLSISYSEFFRNQIAFALLEQHILPGIIAGHESSGSGEPRIWSAGCAAGQEAYSVAILLDELFAGYAPGAFSFRFFATDHSPAELETARLGIYDVSALRNVRLKHLEKYFSCRGGRYHLCETLKKRVSFSFHDLLDNRLGFPAESIYGDFDLVLCSNLLFYYRPDIRQEILGKLCRSLAPGGYLVTSEAERDIVAKHDGFRIVTPVSPIFQKREVRGAV